MYRQGLEVTLASISDLTPEEMSHIIGVCQRREGPANEDAFEDCLRTVLDINRAAKVTTDADLLALRDKLKESKGTKQ